MIKRKVIFIAGLLIIVLLLIEIGSGNGKRHTSALIHVVKQQWRDMNHRSLPGLKGEGILLMDEDSGDILFSINDTARLYPASTTKILTALLMLEKGNPEDLITVGSEVQLRTTGESSAGLRQGQELRLRDLAAAMLLPSGNDAARTAARYIARLDSGHSMSPEESEAYFAGLMNARAKELGAEVSHFVNPHGLHDVNHYSTARDMAVIARAAMENEDFRTLVAEQKHKAELSNISFSNRNKLIQTGGEYYFQGADGIKTGFTDEAGYCLVASASRNGRNLISVVLHSTAEGVWKDSSKLLDYGFKL
ncbi:D-alanyl-D-alanine carboxypeptidase family protein [Paenibacillus sp. YPG26]|uniref:D-alanyl-D-alanine carboxypeptidase family protein n=1 Tax=Paenibacillus sp. YPG26 TaxID=2878915 RepID=UPI00203DB075|nr:D-alanyl-D-alanine carboxypeptidase family protein [Paenibacillus sp. YPG26]USB31951.1 D-alanyl-D-alanine carboxypeptidase [Paenibacillus sp. YPG26]